MGSSSIFNILFAFAIIMGSFYCLYFLLTMYDYFLVQKEHHSRIIFKDKMSFGCAILLLIYMYLNEVTTIGFVLFSVLLFSSLLFNLVIFSKKSVLLFGNKISYENIEKITVHSDKSKSRQFISIKIDSRPRELPFYLKESDFNFLLDNFKNKNVKVI